MALRNTSGNIKRAGLQRSGSGYTRSAEADAFAESAGLDPSEVSHTPGGSSGGSQFNPVNVGIFGRGPGYLGGMFPEAATVDYQNVRPAKYNFIDPIEYAREFGNFNREEYAKNQEQAQKFALDTIDAELKTMLGYVPATAALQRDLVSQENQFNQAERTKQIDSALPDVRDSLRGQSDRANSYARGELPDEIDNKAFELNSRSASADNSAAGGFGQGSNVSRKASDLMSADRRLQVAQFGENLLSTNSQLRQNLELAPTNYANASQQVRINPSVSPAELISSYSSGLNNATLLSPATALSSTINQEQFKTSTRNQVRQFNASNRLAADQFNANAQNSFATSLFGYQVGYAGALAGAAQTDVNTQVALQQQAMAAQIAQQAQGQTQAANQAGSVATGVAAAVTAGAQIVNDVVGTIQDITGGGQSSKGTGSNGQVQVEPVQQPVNEPPASAITVPSESAVPPGYTPIASVPNASGGAAVTAVPTAEVEGVSGGFFRDMRIDAPDNNASTTNALMVGRSVTMEAAGVSDLPKPGYQQVGYSGNGRPVYSSTEAIRSYQPDEGSSFIDDTVGALNPLAVLEDADRDALGDIAAATQDTAFISQLSAAAQNGDKSGFVNAVLNRVAPNIQKRLNDPQDKAALSTAMGAYNIAQYWDRMNSGQRAMALANLGMQGYQTASGEMIAQKVIPGTQISGTEGLTVGGAFNLAASGVNVHSLVNNWGELNSINRLAGGTGTVNSIVQTARTAGLLGESTTGAAVAVDTAQLVNAGWQNASHVGIGAIQAPAGTAIPQGFTAVPAGEGVTVAVPQANAASVANSTTGAQVLSGVQTVAGAASIAAGAYSIYKNWGTGGADGRKIGAMGGAMIAGGLYAMGAALGPVGFAAAVVGGLALGSIKSGRHVDHEKRDAFRHSLKQSGFADQDGMITLTNGMRVPIDQDRKDGMHQAKDPSKIDREGDLYAYDVDYSNDIDFIGAMGGRALTRMLSGAVDPNIDKVGNQIGNAVISSIEDGAELNEGNFSTVMNEMRGQYAKAGIKSKEDAYQLANMMYAEGRLTDTEVVAMHQSFNMMYDKDGFDTAKKLMAGRWGALENQKNNPVDPYEKPKGKRPRDFAYEEALEKHPQIMTNPTIELAPGNRLPDFNSEDFIVYKDDFSPNQNSIVDPNGNDIASGIMGILGQDVSNPGVMY